MSITFMHTDRFKPEAYIADMYTPGVAKNRTLKECKQQVIDFFRADGWRELGVWDTKVFIKAGYHSVKINKRKVRFYRWGWLSPRVTIKSFNIRDIGAIVEYVQGTESEGWKNKQN